MIRGQSHGHTTVHDAGQGRLLEVAGLSVSFAGVGGFVQVLDNIDLTVGTNEIVSLVGESGSGKSVTARTCLGLTLHEGARITAGSVRLDGEELVGASARRWNQLRGRDVGFVFQEPLTSLNPAYTVGNQIVEVIRRHGSESRRGARGRALELLEMVDIPDPGRRLGEYPHQLSGGMQQRVLIAIAVAANPRLLIADEPTTALDVTLQARILDLIGRLRDELDMAVLLVTHDLGVVAEVADRVVVMYSGQIVEQCSVSEVFDRPRHPYTSGLMRSLPQLSAPGEPFGTIPGTVPPPGRQPYGCRFHPRCPYVQVPRCTGEPVALRTVGSSAVRCVRAEELVLEGT